MYSTRFLSGFELPPLSGTLESEQWNPPSDFVAVLWASANAFRRAGVWSRLLGDRPWVQCLFQTSSAEVEALVPPRLLPKTVLVSGSLGLETDQVVAVLVKGGQVQLAVQDSPTEDAWEHFESEMARLGLG